VQTENKNIDLTKEAGLFSSSNYSGYCLLHSTCFRNEILSVLLTKCIYGFYVIIRINSGHFFCTALQSL
jgi:hypothetical protein